MSESNANNRPQTPWQLTALVILVGIIVLIALVVVVQIVTNPSISAPTPVPTATPMPTETPTPIIDFSTPNTAKTSLNGYTLTIAYSIESAPFTSDAINPQGYEIDILNAIVELWKREYGLVGAKFVPINVGGLNNALSGGNDIVVRAISGTTERCSGTSAIGLCTSPSHFQDNYGLITQDMTLPQRYDDVDDFCIEYGGKELTVAVLPNTPVVDILTQVAESCANPLIIKVENARDRGTAVEYLQGGRADIYMTEFEILQDLATASNGTLNAIELAFLEEKPDAYVFMLPFKHTQGKGYEGLWALLNMELAELDFSALCTQHNLPVEKC